MIDFAPELLREEPEREPAPPITDEPERRPSNGALAEAARRSEKIEDPTTKMVGPDPESSEPGDPPAPIDEAAPPTDQSTSEDREADEAQKAELRAETLTVALRSLRRAPTSDPLERLFATWSEAPSGEVKAAARALAALVLRTPAKERSVIHEALGPALERNRSCPLALALVALLGGVFAPPPEPATPPDPPDPPGGDP